jgi:hypothetical protein
MVLIGFASRINAMCGRNIFALRIFAARYQTPCGAWIFPDHGGTFSTCSVDN